MVRDIASSRPFVWLLLALPSVPMLMALAAQGVGPNGEPVVHRLLHPTGEFAARFMILAMIITPMRMLFPKSQFWRWMAQRRRYVGVAAFAYALAHAVLYVIDMGTLQAILGEFWLLGIWTGWFAFAILLPLALTSNDLAARSMGRAWKNLQRLVYVAAVATLIHWVVVHNNLISALVHFVPLAALEVFRLFHNSSQPQRRKMA